jgi:hypothetical protein
MVMLALVTDIWGVWGFCESASPVVVTSQHTDGD